jgi:hypothetical protein
MYFGMHTGLRLRTFTDPDADQPTGLCVLIRSALPLDTAKARLAAFDGEWWVDAVEEAQGKLIIDLDFESCSTGERS